MKTGQYFVCEECGYDQYWSVNDLVDEDGIVNIPTYRCEYCEQSICHNCENTHNSKHLNQKGG